AGHQERPDRRREDRLPLAHPRSPRRRRRHRGPLREPHEAPSRKPGPAHPRFVTLVAEQEIQRVLVLDGGPATGAAPELDAATLRFLYMSMLRIRMLDEKMLLMQRQGRIAFFGPSSGQEAAIVGSGFAARR